MIIAVLIYLIMWLVTAGLIQYEFGGGGWRNHLSAILFGMVWPMMLPLVLLILVYGGDEDATR